MASLSPEAERPPFTLSVASGASLLLLERGNLIQRASFKTGIKSVDAQFPDLFSSGCVIGIGQPKDAESGSVCRDCLDDALLTKPIADFICAHPCNDTCAVIYQPSRCSDARFVGE